jgi:hypothetical protein
VHRQGGHRARGGAGERGSGGRVRELGVGLGARAVEGGAAEQRGEVRRRGLR